VRTKPQTKIKTKTSMKHTRILLLIALLGAAAVGLPSLRAATITVTELGDGFGVHTNLRQALADANDGDTIEFDPLLGGRDLPVAAVLGQLVVNKSVTIRWVPTVGYPTYLGVDAQHANRVFYINPGKTVIISGLTIKNGSAPSPYFGSGIYNDHASLTVSSCIISGNSGVHGINDGVGGGIFNDQGTLIVSDSTLSGNSSWYGGGISNNWNGGSGTATITNSILTGNSATYGGAILNIDGTMMLSNSTVSGNFGSTAISGGGGIYNGSSWGSPMLAITNSTLSGNSAPQGGAIMNERHGEMTITHSTLSGNRGGGSPGFIYNGRGGAFWNAETLTITKSTLSGNSADNQGGGIYNTNPYDTAIVKIEDTILNSGSSGENIYNDGTAAVTSLGYNLSSDNGGGVLTATGDRTNTDPRLGPLQDNGGPTFTHLPASDSPAIDGSDPALSMDQRGPGFQRVVNGRADIGAVEVQAAPSPTPTPSPTPSHVQVTVQTNPAGLAFSVDGTPYTSTQTFTWVPGSSHTIATTSPQNGATGVRYAWSSWTGGGAISHTVAPTTNKTYTANFNTQYFLTMAHGTGGSVSPASGWKNSGVAVSINAMPANGYHFTNWTGSGTGSFSGTTNPASITMSGPITETATFTHN
jgi:Divergent InlB B-repeat domain